MKFSIITICKNSEKTIENTIFSVVNQTYQNIEYIIIDGVSDDNTLDIVKKYSENIAKVISEKDSGIYDAMNKGIKESSGDYILFLNSDDCLLHNNILQLVAEKIALKNSELYYGDLATINKETGCFSIRKHNKFNKIYLIKNTPCQPSTFYRRDVFEKYGNFDTSYKIVSDQEWFLRAFLRHKITSEYLNFPINIFSMGGISTSPAREAKQAAERKHMFDRYFTSQEWFIYNTIAKNFRALTVLPVTKTILNACFKIDF